MKPTPYVLLLACLVCAWLAQPVSGQVAGPATSAPETASVDAALPDAEVEGIVEMPPQPGGYTYNPMGRRDPFMSLIRPVTASNETRARVDGLAGTLIAEAALKGIIKNIDGFIAFFQVSDGKSYWAKHGQRFYDGEITAIDMGSVTFRQEVTDPLSPVRTKEVKKTLNPSEEATP